MFFRLILIGLGILAIRQLFISSRGTSAGHEGRPRRRRSVRPQPSPHGIRNPMFYVERPGEMKSEILESARQEE